MVDMSFTDVAVSCEFKLVAHTSDVRGAHVGAIHETDTVHGAESHDKSSVDAPCDGPLLRLGEAVVDVMVVIAG